MKKKSVNIFFKIYSIILDIKCLGNDGCMGKKTFLLSLCSCHGDTVVLKNCVSVSVRRACANKVGEFLTLLLN